MLFPVLSFTGIESSKSIKQSELRLLSQKVSPKPQTEIKSMLTGSIHFIKYFVLLQSMSGTIIVWG